MNGGTGNQYGYFNLKLVKITFSAEMPYEAFWHHRQKHFLRAAIPNMAKSDAREPSGWDLNPLGHK